MYDTLKKMNLILEQYVSTFANIRYKSNITISMPFDPATVFSDASTLHLVVVIYFRAVSIGIICFWIYTCILLTVTIIEPINTGIWRYLLRQPRRNFNLIDSSFDLVRSIEQNQLQKAAGG